jgi:hypothetical protein
LPAASLRIGGKLEALPAKLQPSVPKNIEIFESPIKKRGDSVQVWDECPSQ